MRGCVYHIAHRTFGKYQKKIERRELASAVADSCFGASLRWGGSSMVSFGGALGFFGVYMVFGE